jgi:hypothetical protein
MENHNEDGSLSGHLAILGPFLMPERNAHEHENVSRGETADRTHVFLLDLGL